MQSPVLRSTWPMPRSAAKAAPSPRLTPGEKILSLPPQTLSDAELLSILVGRGNSGVAACAGRLLAEGSLGYLIPSRPIDLFHQGVTRSGAARLLAAYELARRLASETIQDRLTFFRPADVARYLALHFARHQEVMGALYLDVRHRLLGSAEIFRGTMHRAAVEPSVILREALLHVASGVLVFHTHPSGDPTPSAEDLLFTRRMVEAAGIVGIQLVDHLIITHRGKFVSLKERIPW